MNRALPIKVTLSSNVPLPITLYTVKAAKNTPRIGSIPIIGVHTPARNTVQSINKKCLPSSSPERRKNSLPKRSNPSKITRE